MNAACRIKPLIDEAGAYRKLHPQDQKTQTVGKGLIDDILSKTCQIPKQVVESDEVKKLATLDKRIGARVFGQDEAVGQVVNAVKFSRAGLLEAGKPLASLLFVGPTGVGKTEIAKTLADELGIKLIRYDMSEYEEKHAVAKLIGAPAGYVGYEEGGLLTEEIRKNPHAVPIRGTVIYQFSDSLFFATIKIFKEDIDPEKYVEEKGLKIVNDDGALKSTIEEIIAANPQSVADYHSGKEKALGFLVGQTMKAMKGKANPASINKILKELL